MATADSSTIVGVFEDRAFAQRAIDELRFAGFRDDQIGFAARHETIGDLGIDEKTVETEEDAAKGAVAGGLVGGTIGAVAALLIPGIGPVLAGGILLTTLGGAAVGAAAGGLIGALVGLGVPEEEAHRYHREFEVGRIIVTVQAGDHQKEALDILRRNGALEANSSFGQPVDPDFIARASASDIDSRPQEKINEPFTDNSFFAQPPEHDLHDPRLGGPHA